MSDAVLTIENLSVALPSWADRPFAVGGVSLEVLRKEILCVVGESGSGKSVTSFAVMRILDRAGRIAEGSVMFSGIDVRAADDSKMRDLRGREMSMIFQNPRAALNPIRKVGMQIEFGPGQCEGFDLLYRACNVRCVRIRHRLYSDRVDAADPGATGVHGNRKSSSNFCHEQSL